MAFFLKKNNHLNTRRQTLECVCMHENAWIQIPDGSVDAFTYHDSFCRVLLCTFNDSEIWESSFCCAKITHILIFCLCSFENAENYETLEEKRAAGRS